MGESSAGAGGACTNSLLKVVHGEGIQTLKSGKMSYGTVNPLLPNPLLRRDQELFVFGDR